MMRICFFSGGIDRSGGTERVTAVIAGALAERGYEICILSAAQGERSFFPIDPSVKLYSLHMECHSANLSDWRLCWRLRTFLVQHRIDRLIDVDTVLSWFSIPAAWGTSARVISWEHFHLFINVGDILQRVRRSLGRRIAARWAHKLITLTLQDRQQYLRHMHGRAEIVSIPNPVTIRHNSASDLNSKTVLAAGRLVSQKGFDLLLQVWAQVWPACTDWRLRIVGSGADSEKLQQQALNLGVQDSVEFVPNSSDMVKEYLGAALFVLSSRFEGFGLVLIEAKSCGLPIISFNCACGPAEIVRDGVDGLLVPAEDTHAMAHAMERLINDEEGRKVMGRRALEDQRFELAEIVDAWEQVLA